MFKYENLWVARFYSAEPVTFLENILYRTACNFMYVCVCYKTNGLYISHGKCIRIQQLRW